MPGPLELDRRTLRLIAIAFVLLAALSVHRLYFADVPNQEQVLIIQGPTMGTTYEIRVAGDGLDEALRKRIETMATQRLSEIDKWMSNWNPDSEIARFNTHLSTTDFPVSQETASLVSFALQLGHWSGGAFDIAVGPLVALWGFGSHARIEESPSKETIGELRARLGPDQLRVRLGDSTSQAFLGKNDPQIEIDLSAIAKGYGVDHVAKGLESLGRKDFLVEIGGELRASGERPKGGPWRVAIERPQDEGRAIQKIVALRNQSMATSGDYRIFYVEGGKRVSHTIDPRTGYPVQNGPASVTILAATAAEADAWATTLMVLGEKEGLPLADTHGVGAYILLRQDDGTMVESMNALFREHQSERLQAQPHLTDSISDAYEPHSSQIDSHRKLASRENFQ